MYKFISTDGELAKETISIVPDVYALDIETTGLDPHTDDILLIQVENTEGKCLILDARNLTNVVVDNFLYKLYNTADTIITQNGKFDIKMLLKNYDAVPPKGVLYDTALAEIILYNGLIPPYMSLKKLVKKYLGIELDKEIRNEFIDYDKDHFSPELIEYAAGDVHYLFDICSAQQYFIAKNDLDRVCRLEFDAIPATANMELKGVYLDTNMWLDIYKDNLEKQLEIEKELVEMAREVKVDYYAKVYDKTYNYDFSETPINLNSTYQVRGAFKYFGHKIDSISKDVIESLAGESEFAKKLLDYKTYKKRTSTYGDSFLDHINPVTGRIHCNFNQLGAASGRYSSDDPNLQNIPSRGDGKIYRTCFIAPEGRALVTSDYSQVELRLAAEFSDDPKFIEAYNDGADLHQITADVINRPRPDGKTLNFTILYGASGWTVAKRLNLGSPKEGDKIVDKWKAGFTKLNDFISAQEEFVQTYGYNTTATGRRRYWDMPAGNSKADWIKLNAINREAVNHPIQGTSADMIKVAITNLFYKLRPYDAYPVLTVHDEIMVECPDEIKDQVQNVVEKVMLEAEAIYVTKVPCKVDSFAGYVWNH